MACDAPASPCHALLAENLGKPSLGVIIKDLWYKGVFLQFRAQAPPIPAIADGAEDEIIERRARHEAVPRMGEDLQLAHCITT